MSSTHSPDIIQSFDLSQEVLRGVIMDVYSNLSELYQVRTRPMIRDKYLLPLLELPQGSKIIDMGMGTGHDMKTLAEAGYHVTGVDMTPAMYRIATEKLNAYSNVTLFQANTEELQPPQRLYDGLISALEIFHHPDLYAILQRYSDHLRANGVFVLVTNHPLRNILMHPPEGYFGEGLVWEDWGDHGNVPKYYWTLKTYFSAIQQAGLTIKSIDEYAPTEDLSTIQDQMIKSDQIYPSLISFVCTK
jgi:2-polyprenyl-3-methyl-5-hydroxy-6-metoxy-1,4-benzoquinol methylase